MMNQTRHDPRQATCRIERVGKQPIRRLRAAGSVVAGWAIGLCVLLLFAGAVPEARAAPDPGFKICTDQTYALCALAKCTVFNGVSYCKCTVRNGDSISLPFNYSGGNVCSVNAQGANNGYMISTFSVPPRVLKGGDMAIYSCSAGNSDGAYAQCDGGTCFESTKGQRFPGLGAIGENQIVCSCPITTADPSTAFIGHQIAGPFPCQKDFFANCRSAKAHTRTGGTIYVGAPTGSSRILAKALTGEAPAFNQCLP